MNKKIKKHAALPRTYSSQALQAALLLGRLIKLARKQKKITTQDLCDRTGISRGTLQKIEKGNLKCEIGLVFEVAALLGIPLFEADTSPLSHQLQASQEKLSLLPKRIRPKEIKIDDDF